jgi:hypothetical protein
MCIAFLSLAYPPYKIYCSNHPRTRCHPGVKKERNGDSQRRSPALSPLSSVEGLGTKLPLTNTLTMVNVNILGVAVSWVIPLLPAGRILAPEWVGSFMTSCLVELMGSSAVRSYHAVCARRFYHSQVRLPGSDNE